MPLPRPLTDAEYKLLRWMIENGDADSDRYLAQLNQAQVSEECLCGYDSIDLQIAGVPFDSKKEMIIISDYLYGPISPPCGAFVFSRGGQLAGLNVHSYDETPVRLPAISDLRAIPKTEPCGPASQGARRLVTPLIEGQRQPSTPGGATSLQHQIFEATAAGDR